MLARQWCLWGGRMVVVLLLLLDGADYGAVIVLHDIGIH
jgi:hypothetical protein